MRSYFVTPGTEAFLGVPDCLFRQGRCLTAKTSVGRKDFVNTNIVAPNLIVFVVKCLLFENVSKCLKCLIIN